MSTRAIIEPGSVIVINHLGNLEESHQAYDKKVAGYVSDAGAYRPTIVLGKNVENKDNKNRIPIALMGRVYCKADASHSPIEIGDLLTKGHAMKAEDPYKSFGGVIGKALGSIKQRNGLIPILVSLQ